ncbi:hypothetical protein QZM43_32540 [Burkholderia orbicola]|uniref:hypothetical protein n=1 Tax=Burkholderia orbicola TaxID=2978683 RepID=UPI00265581DB|nr:hypothetical protein [Burkholderia orbicola]MDN7472603.1 hypothetical protein [Burkholderia orbicola]MDN7507473.1 hypothetical protein [Burkholderia orbicola]
MLIREQGRSIKLIRTVRGVDTRRLRQVVIGAFRAGEDVPAELLERLDRNERRELAVWLAAWRDSQAIAQARLVLANAPGRLDELVTALAAAAGDLAPAEADMLWEKLHVIARSLRRAGHRRPKRRLPALQQIPGQLDLIDVLADEQYQCE